MLSLEQPHARVLFDWETSFLAQLVKRGVDAIKQLRHCPFVILYLALEHLLCRQHLLINWLTLVEHEELSLNLLEVEFITSGAFGDQLVVLESIYHLGMSKYL